MLKSYLAIIAVSLKKIFANKSSVIILLMQAIVPSIVMFYLWSIIIKPGQTIGGFTRNQLVIYYIGVNFINSFVWYAIDWELNDDIHSGELSNILHRPIQIHHYYFAKMLGDRLANLILLLPILVVGFSYLFVKKVVQVSLLTLVKFAISLVLAAVLWFLFSYIVGSTAYWFDNLFFVLIVKEIVVNLLSGYYFPLEMLPSPMSKIISFLPFKYFSSFPIDTLVKALPTKLWFVNTATELLWICLLYFILVTANRKGLQRYSDVLG